MTVVADTRFLIVFSFPSTEGERDRVRELMYRSLRDRLVIPSVVITEYIKTAGSGMGKESAVARIAGLKESGAEVAVLDEKTAMRAGALLLEHADKPIGDALIAATALIRRASHVITDDPHFQQFGLKTRWVATPRNPG